MVSDKDLTSDLTSERCVSSGQERQNGTSYSGQGAWLSSPSFWPIKRGAETIPCDGRFSSAPDETKVVLRLIEPAPVLAFIDCPPLTCDG